MRVVHNIQEIVQILRSKTMRNTGFVFAGNLAGQGLGFLATLVVIRQLGPARFGLFSTAIAVMGLASQFSDLGISTGFVRYASIYLKEDQRKADILFRITLYLKVSVGLAVLLLGLAVARPLAVHVFKYPELAPLLQVAFVGSLGATLWGYLQAILQAKEWFTKYAWINVFNNSVKLLGMLALFQTGRLNEWSAIWMLALVPFAGFFIDGFLVPKGFLKVRGSRQENSEVFGELFHLSKWITLSTLCTMFLMRLEVFMLQSLSTSEAVGIYNSANQLAMIFPLVSGALTVSLLPKISAYKTDGELLLYIRKVCKVIPVVLAAILPLVLLSRWLIPLLFGVRYSQAAAIFQVLICAFAIGIALNPVSLVFYSINRARLLTGINIVQFLIAVPLNLYLIPRFGALGASWTCLVIRLFALGYITFWLYRYFKTGRSDHAQTTA